MQPDRYAPDQPIPTIREQFPLQLKAFSLGRERERLAILVAVLVACLHGLLYVFLIPPWQHYDEPNHFEYVWLLANRPGWPKPGDYDQEMRRAVATSMLEHGFFRDLGIRPDLDSPPDQPIWIGQYQQLGEPPLYHLLASLPLRISPSADIDTQLYAARLVSLVMLIITIVAAWGVIAELSPPGHGLRILLPLSLAMLPGFVDLMTAVNSDVAAVALFSLFLWGSLRLILRRFSVTNIVWAGLTAALTYWTKSTIYLAIPLFGMALLLGIFRLGIWRKLMWGILLAILVAGLVATLGWGGAALWYRVTPHNTPGRVESTDTPFGGYALELNIQPGDTPAAVQLRQIIPPETVRKLGGQKVTLGAWMWASKPIVILPPLLFDPGGNRSNASRIIVSQEPAFYAVQGTLPEYTDRAWVLLAPLLEETDTVVSLYYDGIVLVAGEMPLQEAPVFDTPSAISGTWGDVTFTNLVRNSSAETAAPRVQPWSENIGSKVIPDRGSPSLVLYSLTDLKATGWYYRVTAFNLVRTFWAKFSWGHVPLLGHKPYRVVGAVTMLGLFGTAVTIWRKRAVLRWDVAVYLALALIGIWGITWLRGSLYLFHWIFIPSARYAFPAIIPTMLVLNLGWLELIKAFTGVLRLPGWSQFVVYFTLMFALDTYALVSIMAFF